MTRSYIGVTGFSSCREVRQLRAILENLNLPDGLEFSPGVLVSRHTLFGGRSKAARYPNSESVGDLLRHLCAVGATALHYNSRDCPDLEGEIEALLAVDGVYEDGVCRRVQLNIANPDVDALARLRQRFPQLELILQVPLSVPGFESVASVAGFLDRYSGSVDYVLFDTSGGRGTELSDERLEIASQAFSNVGHEFGVGIAGGLHADNVLSRVEFARSLFGRIPLSVDAESKLRGGRCKGVRVGDMLNPDRVAGYVRAAADCLG